MDRSRIKILLHRAACVIVWKVLNILALVYARLYISRFLKKELMKEFPDNQKITKKKKNKNETEKKGERDLRKIF